MLISRLRVLNKKEKYFFKKQNKNKKTAISLESFLRNPEIHKWKNAYCWGFVFFRYFKNNYKVCNVADVINTIISHLQWSKEPVALSHTHIMGRS